MTSESVLRLVLAALLLGAAHALRVPKLLEGAVLVAVLGATLAGVTGAYNSVWWLDDVAHFFVTGLLALAATVGVTRHEAWGPQSSDQHLSTCIVVAVLAGLAFALLWELYEWGAINVLGARLLVSNTDMLADVSEGALAALMGGLAVGGLGRRSGKSWGER